MFEYKLVSQDNLETRILRDVERFLDFYGHEGWELCAIDYGCFIFKRAKRGQANAGYVSPCWDDR